MEFDDRATREAFSRAVIAALDAFERGITHVN
jgi:hypothetical protein